MPRRFISDNAPSFHSTAEFMKRCKLVHPPSQKGHISWGDLTWDFYQAKAPHMGGSIERMVQAMKRCLWKLLPAKDFTDEELHTAAVFAEDILNRRPLSVISTDPDDPSVLTPGHFLYGGQAGDFRATSEACTKLQSHWASMNKFRQEMWQQFLREVIPTREQRDKWHSETPPIKVGDWVVVLDHDLTKWGRWPLGKILEVNHGHDGLVRGATLRCNKREITRHVKSLCPLFPEGEEGGSN